MMLMRNVIRTYRIQCYESILVKRAYQTNSKSVIESEIIIDRKSAFQAFLQHVQHQSEVDTFKQTIKQRPDLKKATHFITAYHIEPLKQSSDQSNKQPNDDFSACGAFDDGGEAEAGQKLYKLMTLMQAVNVCVVVVRSMHGPSIGSARFRHINQCAAQVMKQAGFGKQTVDDEPSKKKKKR